MKGLINSNGKILNKLDLPFILRASGLVISDKEIKDLQV